MLFQRVLGGLQQREAPKGNMHPMQRTARSCGRKIQRGIRYYGRRRQAARCVGWQLILSATPISSGPCTDEVKLYTYLVRSDWNILQDRTTILVFFSLFRRSPFTAQCGYQSLFPRWYRLIITIILQDHPGSSMNTL